MLGLLAGRALAADSGASPDADSFLRANDPAHNFGRAGALAVAGPNAVNAAQQPGGAFASLLRFPVGPSLAGFDVAYGAGGWRLTGVVLELNEVAAPRNSLFNRGTGVFEVDWLAGDSWSEGTGSPSAPATDGVGYGDLPGLAGEGRAVRLGQFANAGQDRRLTLALPAADPAFRADLLGGGSVTLLLVAVDADLGFTLRSRDYGVAAERPVLRLTADSIPEPGAAWLLIGAASVALAWRRGFPCRSSPQR
jgi:hypothetical protein